MERYLSATVREDLARKMVFLVERFPNAPAWQIALREKRNARTPEGIRLAPAATLLRTLA